MLLNLVQDALSENKHLILFSSFDFEISEDDCETFTTVNDLVEFVSRNFYAK